ncbi:hypothetical protein QTI51_37130 [Variovorax sp. J22G73]|uniref:hypothetical protein n=1 Tax=unclassified Variovorax TaxID=663243 RepID=UPI002574DC87|nr:MULTISPECIES: hypothetical protein [unclassified Variovorax]MDM0010188.1 hypothetical protein [Variovorax sp. J22R203]MDM0102950.1 hypothetical protein [Variovorax sp. J22G73]
MDDWLLEFFDGNCRAIRQRGRELWWCGWTAVVLRAIPLVLMWGIVQLPRDSLFATLASSHSGWGSAAALVILYVGLVMAASGWYLYRLSKRLQTS